MAEPRDPRDVPDVRYADPWGDRFEPTLDTDGDGLPDTTITDDGVDLVITTDLDDDGLADQIVRIGPDGIPRRGEPPHRGGSGVLAALFDVLDPP